MRNPNAYLAAGKQITCPHCQNDEFYIGKAQLNTQAATFFRFDWLNRSAVTLTCSKCGLIQWFDKEPQKMQLFPDE